MQHLTTTTHARSTTKYPTQVYQRYRVHTSRKMMGPVRALERLQRPNGWLAPTIGDLYIALTCAGECKSASIDNFNASYPTWLKRDLLTVWSDDRFWNARGRINRLSLEGRQAVATIESKMAGFVPRWVPLNVAPTV